ncbi:MAG: DUF1801 domain-containing protein [Cryomorphaceae bacterium]|nr:DUF1801 domain-containing protein [Cryomorphaceae bacterium]
MNEVTQFIDALKHPLSEVVSEMRSIITTIPTVTEHIKWNAPSFVYQGDDRITFNFSGGKLRVIFHAGAKKKELPPQRLIADNGLLKWASNDRAIFEVKTAEQFSEQRLAFSDVVHKWLACFNHQIMQGK